MRKLVPNTCGLINAQYWNSIIDVFSCLVVITPAFTTALFELLGHPSQQNFFDTAHHVSPWTDNTIIPFLSCFAAGEGLALHTEKLPQHIARIVFYRK